MKTEKFKFIELPRLRAGPRGEFEFFSLHVLEVLYVDNWVVY